MRKKNVTDIVTVKKHLVAIDTTIDGYKGLIEGVEPQAEILLVNSATSLAKHLSSHHCAQSLTILSHGEPGVLLLGDDEVNEKNLDDYHSLTQAISASLSETGALLLYGCEIAKGKEGRSFIDTFENETGVSVAASETLTGHPKHGGSWELEMSPSLPQWLKPFDGTKAAFSQTLGTFSFSTATGDGTSTINETVDGITVTVSGPILTLAQAVLGNGVRPSSSITNPENYTVAFSSPVDISIFHIFETPGVNANDGGNYSVAVTNGNGTTITMASTDAALNDNIQVFNAADSSNGFVPWTSVTELTVSYSGTDPWRLGLDEITFTATPANTAPAFSGLDGAPTFNKNGSAVVLDENVTVADTELDALNSNNGNYSGASLTIARNGGANTNDSFSIQNGTNFTVSGSDLQSSGQTFGTFSNSGGTLTVTFNSTATTATTALTNEVLQAISYSNTSNSPATSVQLDWVFNDGSDNSSGSNSTTVTIDTNTAPSFTGLDGAPAFTEGGTAVVLDADVSVADPELDAQNGGDGNYSGASFTIARNGGANANDSFSIENSANITVSGSTLSTEGHTFATVSNSGGTLTVTFNTDASRPSSAIVDELLQSIRYSNTSDNPAASVQLDWTFSDGAANSTGSNSTTVSITPVNDAPTFTGLNGTPAFTEGGSATVLDADVTIADPELDALNGGNGDYAGASVTIARQGGANSDDSFSISLGTGFKVEGSEIRYQGQIFATLTNSGGTLTVDFTSTSTAATTAYVNQVLQGIRYSNTSDGPPATVQLDWTFSDGSTSSTGANSTTVTITGENDAPTSAGNTVTMNEDTSYTFKAADFNFADVDSGDSLASVTITSTNLETGDTLLLDGVAVTLDTPISAGDIGKLVFTPAANANGNGRLTFNYTVNDGTVDSTPATMTIDVNDVAEPVVVTPTPTPTPAPDPDPVPVVVREVDDTDNSSDEITGGTLNDTLEAGGGDDTVEGGDGSDSLTGGAGNDSLDGGNDDDFIDAGVGDDTVDGGVGQDSLFGGAGNDTVNAGDGNDFVKAGEDDTGDDVISGDQGDDTLGGGAGSDTVNGGTGADLLWGREGDDTLDGGDGDDVIYNGDGNDTVSGGAGADKLWASAGDDILTGGDGADTFIFGAKSGNDVIADFDVNEDKLHLAFTSLENITDVQAAATSSTRNGQDGLLIDLGNGQSVFLNGLTIDDLNASNVSF